MLLLNNQDVERLVTAADCVDVLDEAYREWAFERAAQFPAGGRMDLVAPSPGPELNRRFTWGAMAGVVPKHGIFALRQKFDIHYHQQHPSGELTMEKYCIQPGTFCGFIILASISNAEPLAILNDGVFQHLRVAGTGAVAARYLAREDASVLGIIGSGGMAHSHAVALASIRPIREVRVYSMTPANREAFAKRMTGELGIPVRAVDSAAAAVRGADIVSMCTDSAVAIFPDESWLEAGMHITGVVPSELGNAANRADVVFLHERGGIVEERALGEGLPEGRGVRAFAMEGLHLEQDRQELPTLAELTAGLAQGRTDPQQITYFHNVPGAGIQFAAVGAKILRLAKEQGVGTEIPTDWFLQDIRD